LKESALVIKGDVPSKKNSKQIFRNRITGRPFIKSSEAYERWHPEAAKQLMGIEPVDIVTTITLTFYPSSKRRSDLTNKAESIMDLLVDCKIILDDNWFKVPKLVLQFGEVDKINPRVEIIIY
jgi:hypothetical protein